MCGVLLSVSCAYSLGACTRYLPAQWSHHQPPKVSWHDPPSGLGKPPYLGAYLGASPTVSISTEARRFVSLTGSHPKLMTLYTQFGAPFAAGAALADWQAGAVPVFQIAPKDVSLAAVTGGRYDTYLDAYARAVRAFGHPLILSFGHEMNGNWYSWGYGHVPPRTFVAAWRHIVALFRTQDARNVTWLWTVNIDQSGNRTVAPIAAWWPGASYVTWVGIDGYFRVPSDSFVPLFGPTIAQIAALTTKPILIAETAVPLEAQAARQVAGLFAGVRAYGLLGFIWFDAIGSRNWQLQGDPPALAAFRKAAKGYR